MESTENESENIQTVEIIKQPGQTLGFYIREGNGVDRTSGVFISRIANGSVVARNGLLRVSDEILSVNSVDVTHMSLDDVVILMSIAKCLVLTVRFQKPHTLNAIVSNAEEQEQDAGSGRNQQPVVVLKSGFANSFSGMTIEDRSPDDLTVVDSARYGHRTLPSQTMYGTGMRNGRFRSTSNPGSDQTMDPYFYPKGMHDLQRSGKALIEQGNSGLSRIMYGDPPGRAYDSYPGLEYDPQSFEKVLRPGSGKNVYSSPRAPQRHLDYASDTDVTYHPCRTPFEQLMSRCNPYKCGSLNSGHGFPDRATRSHNGGIPSHYINGNEQYSSDSEIMTHYHRSSRGGGRMTSRPPGDQSLSRRVEGSEIFYSLPHKGRDEYRDYQHQLSLQNDLSHRGHVSRPKPADSYADVHSGYYTEMSPARKGTSGCKMPISSSLSSDEYAAWLSHRASPVNTTSPSRGLNLTNHRLTRKMSTDSLLDYKTYQMEDPGNVYPYSETKRSKDIVYGPDLQRRVKDNQQSYAPMSTMTLSRAQHGMAKNTPPSSALMSSMSLSASESSRSKGGQLARSPLKIQTETFHVCPSGENTVSDDAPGLSGLLFVRVFCGHGLKSSRTALRDLYCVIEVNTTNKARTMIRTGAINFDWDEEFEIDIEDARRLAFLVYSWDPHTRHTLCFTGVLSLVTALRQAKYQRLAMKLEPKGTLYVELNYTESSVALLRKPSVRRNGVFGVDLKTIVLRENFGYGVPIVVIRCVEEVERRGLDHVGLYRLCGSSRRKQQLKEEVERNVQAADLSIEAVTDINVITCVLKDFLRELPEPLCSNALYQMLLDALSVQVPGDHEGNTQLMLGILECLPRVNQETLAYLLNHLKRVALKSDVNKMTTLNLAICLGPALVCPSTDDGDRGPASGASSSSSVSPQTMNFNKQIELLKYLLDIWHENQNLPKNSNSEGGLVVPPHPSSKSPRNKRFPERSLSDSNGGRKQNQQQEREEALAWENAETSPC